MLWVGGHLGLGQGDKAVRTAVQEFVDAGKPVVGHGPPALRVTSAPRPGRGAHGRGNPFGNGIVDVDTPASSFLAAGALDHGFIYPAYAFTSLGADTTVAQTYDVGDPFLAGHWRRSKSGVGPQGVDGLASVIAGEGAAARAVVFGTSVVFRTHTRGQMGQAARALFWAGPEAGVPAPRPDGRHGRPTSHLRRCVELAREALDDGDEPFGSVLVDGDGVVRFEDRNRVKDGDQTRHPELEIARWAPGHLTPEERAAATVYTSGEHCAMCAAAHAWVGLGRIVYAVSSAQLTGWRRDWGAGPPVVPLPIGEVVPGDPSTDRPRTWRPRCASCTAGQPVSELLAAAAKVKISLPGGPQPPIILPTARPRQRSHAWKRCSGPKMGTVALDSPRGPTPLRGNATSPTFTHRTWKCVKVWP